MSIMESYEENVESVFALDINNQRIKWFFFSVLGFPLYQIIYALMYQEVTKSSYICVYYYTRWNINTSCC